MKKKASVVLKQIIVSLLSSIGKAKSRTRTLKARLVMLSLMNSKKVIMDSLSNKIHNLLGHHKEGEEDDEDQSKAIVLYNSKAAVNDDDQTGPSNQQQLLEIEGEGEEEDDDNDKYPDLRHSLFDEEEFDEDLQNGGSVIDLVRNSKEKAEDFRLEDEIDHVADLFIMRFHKQMRMQKLLSFKRYQEMLERSV